jgi:hypothetical protein
MKCLEELQDKLPVLLQKKPEKEHLSCIGNLIKKMMDSYLDFIGEAGSIFIFYLSLCLLSLCLYNISLYLFISLSLFFIAISLHISISLYLHSISILSLFFLLLIFQSDADMEYLEELILGISCLAGIVAKFNGTAFLPFLQPLFPHFFGFLQPTSTPAQRYPERKRSDREEEIAFLFIYIIYYLHYSSYYSYLCYIMLCYVMLCYVMLCYVMLCYVMLCYVMLCYYVMLYYIILYLK